VGNEPASDAGLPAGVAGSCAAGAQVGGYRLEQQLGQGGMAVVYLARDERLDRLVALKIMAPERAADEAFRTRFIRESRAAAAVDHPHIIPVFEAGDADGLLYIAMRYVPGGDVGTIVRREGPLSPGRAAAVIAQVASALDVAHAAGLVHRDVKPANMLVDVGGGRSDHVYLSDFGVSKKTVAASAGLTGTGQIVGTWDYVAPEQIKGKPPDGRTDQYGLACAAFELLTGAPPFQREEASAVLYAHLSEPPPPVGSRREDLPPAADQVLARALAKAPTDRYPSCQEFADALLDALGTAPHGVSPQAAEEATPDHPPTQIAWVSDPPVPAVGAAAGTASPPYAVADLPAADAGIPVPPAAADAAGPVTQTAPAAANRASGRAAGPDVGPARAAYPGPPGRVDDQQPPGAGPAPRRARPRPPAETATAAAARSASAAPSRAARRTAGSAIPIRKQRARLRGPGDRGEGTLLLYPDKLVHVRSRAFFWAASIGFIAGGLAASFAAAPSHPPSLFGALLGAVAGWIIAAVIARRQAAGKAAAAGDGVRVLPLDSITGLKARKSTGIGGWLGGQSLAVTTAGGAEYWFGVRLKSWSADLDAALTARGRTVTNMPEGLAVTRGPRVRRTRGPG
jgi:hypothetical protein